MTSDDLALVREFAANHSESAFRTLVQRHAGLVHSAARRQVRDTDLAEEITQAVFIILARKAAVLGPKTILSAWLYRTTHYVASDALKRDRRRRRREQEAHMQSTHIQPDSGIWTQLEPILDEVMGQLGEADRTALILRFFENKSGREIAAALRIEEAAAHKRVTRSLEKLRAIFIKRGIALSATALAATLAAKSVQAAPAGLVETLATASASGATVAMSVITLANGTIKTIVMTTIQKALATAALVTTIGVCVIETAKVSRLQSQVAELKLANASREHQTAHLTDEKNEALREAQSLRDLNGFLTQQARASAKTQAAPATGPGKDRAARIAMTEPDNPLAQVEAELGHEIGEALVRGEPDALQRLSTVMKAARESFQTNGIGLDETARAELARKIFATQNTAMRMVQDEALKKNPGAFKAINDMIAKEDLQSLVIPTLGKLAADGNDDALQILLAPEQSGVTSAAHSSVVAALGDAASAGNQQAIDQLAAVTRDEKNRALFWIVANSLNKPAESGNDVAIDTLINLAGTTNQNVRGAVMSGLRKAAANQNRKAADTLATMNR